MRRDLARLGAIFAAAGLVTALLIAIGLWGEHRRTERFERSCAEWGGHVETTQAADGRVVRWCVDGDGEEI